MKRIFLIGYMGAGKTTLGKELAKVLNIEFLDLDLYIEKRHNKTINQIFEASGEEGFRSIERAMLQEVSHFENIVVSTGGGVPCFFDNMKLMNETGTTVYLEASPKLLADRLSLSKDKRPLIKDKNESELLQYISENLEKRAVYYKQAKIIFDTNGLVRKEDIKRYVHLLVDRMQLEENKGV